MRAIRLHRTGGPEVLQLDEIPMPAVGPDQVLVKAHAIGVGTADQLVRTGRYDWQPALPTIPGLEMSGWVAAAGNDVAHLREGDRVVVSAVQKRSCYAEYTAEDAKWVYPVPDGVDLAAAACLFNFRTAYRIVHAACRVQRGDVVAVVGAAGGVGGALVQLANLAGATTIAIVRGAAKAAFADSIGATHVVDTRAEDLGSRIGRLTAGRGVDFFLDPVAGPGFADNLAHLAPVGMLALYGILADWPPDDVFRQQRADAGRSAAVRIFSMHAYDDDAAIAASDCAHLLGLLADRELDPALFARLPLEMAADAHAMLEDGKVVGKIVLQPDLTAPQFEPVPGSATA